MIFIKKLFKNFGGASHLFFFPVLLCGIIIISYGVISTPELTDWQPLTANDSYLVAASDGIFEKLSSQDVCDIMWEVHGRDTMESELSSICSYSSLADCLVNTAFDKGSMDNMAAVLVPLRSTGLSQNLMTERCDGDGPFDCSTLGIQKSIYRPPGEISFFGEISRMLMFFYLNTWK